MYRSRTSFVDFIEASVTFGDSTTTSSMSGDYFTTQEILFSKSRLAKAIDSPLQIQNCLNCFWATLTMEVPSASRRIKA